MTIEMAEYLLTPSEGTIRVLTAQRPPPGQEGQVRLDGFVGGDGPGRSCCAR
ncbi:hypothetical protein [Nonomuraea typhae]|uniref:Uncharacterized protein n=1 Tax=Nonomuraea typhae TaxID=2603600 RepID=A0ABW7Z8E9_9ACTN